MKTSFSSFGSFSDPAALLIVVLTAAALPTAVQAQCLTTGFVLEGVTECSIDGLRTSFDRMFQGAQTAGLSCNHNAATELRLLLGASTDEQADATLKANVCRPGFDNYENKLPFESIAGYGTKFDDDYFTKGGSAFNEQRATRYDKYDERIDNNDDELYLLEDDAAHIDSFYDAQGRYGMVEFPDSHVTSLQNCEHHAMYCCWPQDRQANDNNGNCDDPYDDNCLDSDPADNTDLCYSTNESSKLVFPGEDNNNQRRAEGPIHCHGTAWADSSTADTSWAFRGNNLFYISMYDHLYQRGYVRNIPGSAMCGCAEDMPVASRSDCTEMDVDLEMDFLYDGTTWTMNLQKMAIAFNACQGVDRFGEDDDNDLWSYANRLYMEDKMSETDLLAISKQLVGDPPTEGICRDAEERMMHEEGYMVGFNGQTDGDWTPVIGKGFMALKNPDPTLGSISRKALVASGLPIIERLCPHCYITHQHIFYKRLTPVPAGLDLLDDLAETNSVTPGNVWGVDFSLHSTYQDAVDGTNPWACPNNAYDYGSFFPGNCSPSGERVRDQTFRITQWGHRSHGAWYVAGASPYSTASTKAAANVGGYRGPVPGSVFTAPNGDIHLTSTAFDVWNDEDEHMFLPKAIDVNSDFELTVYIKELAFTDSWTKTGLIIRESMDANSKNVAIVVSGQNGVRFQVREETGGDTRSYGYNFNGVTETPPVWVRLAKKANEFTASLSADGTTWQVFDAPRYLNIDPTNMVAGALMASHQWGGKVAEAVISNFEATVVQRDGSFVPVSPSSYADIGNADSAVGLAEQDSTTGSYKISAAGSGQWGADDHFGFLHFPAPSGDFSIQAKISSIDPSPNAWTKAGIIIRDGLEEGAGTAISGMTKERGLFSQVRETTGGDIQNIALRGTEYAASFGFVRLTKIGSVVTFERSPEGNKWEVVQMIDLEWTVNNPNLLVGMMLTASAWQTRATAVFESWTVTPVQSSQFTARSGVMSSTIPSVTVGNYDGGMPGGAFTSNGGATTHVVSSSQAPNGNEDAFQIAPLSIPSGGDYAMTAYITDVQSNGIYYKAGLMVREGDSPSSRHVSLYTSGDRVLLSFRTEEGAGTHTHGWGFEGVDEIVPLWMRLEKRNNQYTGYLSIDGTTWQQFDKPVYMNLEPSEVMAGLGMSSNQWSNEFAEVIATNYEIAALPPANPGFVPVSDAIDMSPTTGLGFSEYDAGSSTYVITAIGDDIWNAADGGHFVYFEASGNFEIQAYIASINPSPDTWTKAGVMIRESLESNSMNAFSFMTLDRGAAAQFRPFTNAATASYGIRWSNFGPVSSSAVRLKKVGNIITYSRADDGTTFEDYKTETWNGSGNVYVGMAVSSNRWKSQRATARFENWQFTQL